MTRPITITKCTFTDVKKDGTKIVNKWGKPSYRTSLITKEFGPNVWVSGFLPFPPDKWEGTTQELEIYEEEYNGNIQKKFKLPPKTPQGVDISPLVARLQAIETLLSDIHGHLSGNRRLDRNRRPDRNSDGSLPPDFGEDIASPFDDEN